MIIVRMIARITPPSANEGKIPWIARGRGGKPYPVMHKNPEISKYQDELRQAFQHWVDPSLLPQEDQIGGVVTYYVFGLSQELYVKRDLSNFVKATEDAVFYSANLKVAERSMGLHLLPYDDNKVIAAAQRKVLSPQDFVFCAAAILTPGEPEDSVLAQLIASSDLKHIDAMLGGDTIDD